MAASAIVTHGDMIQVSILPPTLVPPLSAPVPLVATGFAMVDGKAVCVEGDELPPSLKAPLPYTSPPFVVPGMGRLSVTLQRDNKSAAAADDGKAMLLVGQTFQAKFEVQVPAQQPTPGGPVPDPTPSYSGTARFVSTDVVAEAE
ncbi:MAG: hypothetical protein U0324_25365 [Polyangiales bacterium]